MGNLWIWLNKIISKWFMCLGWNIKHGPLIFKICGCPGFFRLRADTTVCPPPLHVVAVNEADGGQYVCFDWGVMDAGWGASGVRTSARLASESAPVWNDSSHRTETHTSSWQLPKLLHTLWCLWDLQNNALQWMMLIKSLRSRCVPLTNELL